MQWQAVESSQISEVGFEAPDTLGIRFKAKGKWQASEYHYSGASDDLFGRLVGAESVGKFFEANIKPFPDKYPYRKITNGTQPLFEGIKVEIDAPGSALAKIDGITVTEMFTPGFMDPILEAVRTEVMSQAAKLDISTEANRKAIASIAYRVAKSKTFVDAQRKAYVGEQKKKLAAIDAVGNQIWTILEGIQSEVRRPLTEWEDKEKARVKDLEDGLAELRAIGPAIASQWDTLPLQEMRNTLQRIEGDARDWQEFSSLAHAATVEAVEMIDSAIERRKKANSEKLELERLRAESAERQKQDEIEAAANAARVEAERAQKAAEERAAEAQKRLEAEQQANARRTEEAAAEAKRAAERAVEAERERVAAEEKAAQDAAEARARNEAHRKKINSEVEAFLLDLDLAPEWAALVVAAIANGKVPHVRIDY